MNTEKYTQEVNVIKERFDNDLQELGLRIRNEVVAPACKNHGLKFFSGNGTFFFAKGDITYSDSFTFNTDHLQHDPIGKALKPIIDLLNTEITHNDYLGFYVGQVR